MKQLRLGEVYDRARLEAVDALLVTYQDEDCDEAACSSHADDCAIRWLQRLKSFVGVDERTRVDVGPWNPNVQTLSHNAEQMFQALCMEVAAEKEDAAAQELEDKIMATALRTSSSSEGPVSHADVPAVVSGGSLEFRGGSVAESADGDLEADVRVVVRRPLKQRRCCYSDRLRSANPVGSDPRAFHADVKVLGVKKP